MSFQKVTPLEERKAIALKVFKKYPDRIPVIIEKSNNGTSLPDLQNKKYLLPQEMKCSQLIYIIRNGIKITAEKAIFIFINKTLVPLNTTIAEVYSLHKNKDDSLLYIEYTTENTFG